MRTCFFFNLRRQGKRDNENANSTTNNIIGEPWDGKTTTSFADDPILLEHIADKKLDAMIGNVTYDGTAFGTNHHD